jgi:hypothetical protein
MENFFPTLTKIYLAVIDNTPYEQIFFPMIANDG